MHRHGYKGRKFGRETDQRRALVKGLATSLVIYGSIETTIQKAKEVVPYAEKLITKAKRGDLHGRRQVIAGLSTIDAGQKLFDEIAPKLTGRTSGHLRIERTRLRVGDNAQLARVSFVDDINVAAPKAEKREVAKTEVKTEHDPKKCSAATKAAAPKSVKADDKHLSHKPAVTVRKSGER
jgi:large subunit ribosomal protein L17